MWRRSARHQQELALDLKVEVGATGDCVCAENDARVNRSGLGVRQQLLKARPVKQGVGKVAR